MVHFKDSLNCKEDKMLSNCRNKKVLVLALAGAILSLYLSGVIAIAQTADKVTLTPEDMSQIYGQVCRECHSVSGRWLWKCSYAVCNPPACTGTARAQQHLSACGSTSGFYKCGDWASGYYYVDHTCACNGSRRCAPTNPVGVGVGRACSDFSTNPC